METTTALATLKTAVTYIASVMSEVVTVVISNPIFLIPVGIFVVGAGIGLCARLIGR